VTYRDIIGYEDVKHKLNRLLSFSDIVLRQKLERFGQNRSLGGVLLYGPPGIYRFNLLLNTTSTYITIFVYTKGNCKTRIIMASACEHKLPVISLSSADVYSAYVGNKETILHTFYYLTFMLCAS
jgi:SpoVK/Ycf46/Vps4 family AAA+-type ATPase